jgi:peroxiredoxin
MAASNTPTLKLGTRAPEFELKGVDGRSYRFKDVAGEKGTLVAFICNHCPYVKAIIGRLVAEAEALRGLGIGTIAIMPNDTDAYPADGFDAMQAFARRHQFGFPYVIDTSQAVARAYGALATPDFFGFNARRELKYHGRLDASRTALLPAARRELFEAMQAIAENGEGPAEQLASVGCSIKWRP